MLVYHLTIIDEDGIAEPVDLTGVLPDRRSARDLRDCVAIVSGKPSHPGWSLTISPPKSPKPGKRAAASATPEEPEDEPEEE